eukprot:TRINITY_DN10648_c0_g1_i1.p1 TRINITY_DN10648_c0_g1~~TRINITY_DN10648_c0_g1_i1.p1  ORF type:complete len:1021 (-),score=472.43 TRINITY_DN10648_c0_g1_i1:124-3186(-)
MFLQWRRFQFFEKELVKEEGSDAPHSLFQRISVTCATSGRGRLIFGDADGCMHVVERDFKTVVAFAAYERAVTHCQQLRDSNTLVTVGDDDEAIAPTIKIWNLDRPDKLLGQAASCVRIIKLQRLTTQPLVPVTSLAVLDDLSQLAVGLCNGVVVLMRGDLLRDRHSKQLVLQEPESRDPVTALHFRPPPPAHLQQQQGQTDAAGASQTVLYVVSSGSIWAYFTPGARQPANEFYKAELDADRGAGLGCSALVPYYDAAAGAGLASAGPLTSSSSSMGTSAASGSPAAAVGSGGGELAVARPEAVYFYTPDGRGPCFAFEGDKKLVGTFRGYLWLAGQDTAATSGSASGSGSAGPGSGRLQLNWLSIYDVKNKLVAYTEVKFGPVQHVLSEWGQLFVLTAADGNKKGGQLWRLHEKDSGSKLETLFNKKLFQMAINLAHSHGADRALVVDIYRRYADHLYDKADYDGAIQQYINTINPLGSQQPQQPQAHGAPVGGLEPSYVIRRFLDAQRIRNLTAYLQALHEHGLASADHTALLFNCYTKLNDVAKLDQFVKATTTSDSDSGSDAPPVFEVDTALRALRQAGYYEHALFVARRHRAHDWYLRVLLDDLGRTADALSYIVGGALDFWQAERALKKYGKRLLDGLPAETTALLVKLCTGAWVPDQPALKASPEDFIQIFVSQPDSLQVFLERLLASGHGQHQQQQQAAVYTTLLELYLRADGPEHVRKANRKKALDWLTDPTANYDLEQALVLCKQHEFGDGLVYLYERLQLYTEVGQHYMQQQQHEQLLKACNKFGELEPQLWLDALAYFAALGNGGNAAQQQQQATMLKEVLVNIERNNLLPPLLVIQMLSEQPHAPLGLVRDYINRKLLHEAQMIHEDKAAIKKFSEETHKMRTEMADVRSSARIFQLNKCSYCSAPLDLPAVHFFCLHSFHQRCLGEIETECPLCQAHHKKVLEIKRNLEQQQTHHDSFFKQLEGAADGFTTVSEYFGRSVFNPSRPRDVVRAKPNPHASRELLFK